MGGKGKTDVRFIRVLLYENEAQSYSREDGVCSGM
jgi:hypothetical protein